MSFIADQLKDLLDEMMTQNFHDKQWEFTASFFSESVFTRILSDDFVLSFLSDEKFKKRSFETVHRIQVEHSYQQFDRETYHETSYRTLWIELLIC